MNLHLLPALLDEPEQEADRLVLLGHSKLEEAAALLIEFDLGEQIGELGKELEAVLHRVHILNKGRESNLAIVMISFKLESLADAGNLDLFEDKHAHSLNFFGLANDLAQVNGAFKGSLSSYTNGLLELVELSIRRHLNLYLNLIASRELVLDVLRAPEAAK